MNELVFFVIATVCILLILTIVIQRLCFRKILKEKDYGIFQQIKEQTRLARELEHTLIEKNTLEKIVHHRLNDSNNQQNMK